MHGFVFNETGDSPLISSEEFDAVLGYYQVSLVAGRRYLAVMNNLIVGATVATDLYSLRIRNSGSSSNPTAASTAVAYAQWYCPAVGGAGEENVIVAGSFIAPTNGINTFGFSAQRAAGTGALTPLSNTPPRELYVMYLGVV